MSQYPYKDMFGKPGEGAHAHRLFGVAIVDVILTLILALIISLKFGSFARNATALFLTSIVAHRAFGVRTTVDKLLFD
jgi:hypothetical protein